MSACDGSREERTVVAPSTNDIENERLATLREADIKGSEKFRPGSYGCHEALHVSSMLTDIAEAHLLKHPAILLDSELYRRARDIHGALFDLYQAIGEKHLADQADMKPLNCRQIDE